MYRNELLSNWARSSILLALLSADCSRTAINLSCIRSTCVSLIRILQLIIHVLDSSGHLCGHLTAIVLGRGWTSAFGHPEILYQKVETWFRKLSEYRGVRTNMIVGLGIRLLEGLKFQKLVEIREEKLLYG